MWCGLRLQPVKLYPVALTVIVIKLYPYYHHNDAELIFSYSHSVAANKAPIILPDTMELYCVI